MRLTNTVAAAALTLGSAVYAQTVQKCTGNACFSINIPDATASSGSGDVYMQITAPTTYTWVGFGQGSQMSGSNMFILYTDASGTNVTLSPRLGTGHVMPNYNSAADITLLDGTGVSNGMMTANFRCSSCASWSGGKMDLTSSTGSFIYGLKSGSPLNSDSNSASISQHGSYASFSLNLANARGGSSLNPFVSSDAASSSSASSSGTGSSTTAAAAAGASGSSSATSSKSIVTTCTASSTITSSIASPSGSGCPTAWPTAWTTSWPQSAQSLYASCFSGYSAYSHHGRDVAWPTAAPMVMVKRAVDTSCSTDSSGSSSSSSGSSSSSSPNYGSGSYGFSQAGIPFGGDFEKATKVMIAHGVLASLAFVILFPAGAISIRLLSFPGLIWLHVAFQVLAYVVYIAAFGLGIYLATNLHYLNEAHPIIGIVLFILIFFQPLLGFLHHRYFKAHARRSFWSYGHIWLGRIIILLGIINGGLGLQLAQNTRSGEIAYGVIAAVVGLVYVAAIVIGEMKRKRNAPPSYDKSIQMGQMGSGSDEGSPVRQGQRYA